MDLVSSKNDRSTCFQRNRKLCYGLIIGFIGFVLLIVILAFTVFKAKHTITTVNSIKLKGLRVSLNAGLGVDFNVTLDLNLSVKNPNKAGFKYGNSSTFLYYRGDVVGEAGIPAGQISPGETIGMNSTLTVLADRLMSRSDVYSDVMSGMFPVSTYTRIAGRVSVLKIFKHHMVSITSCDIVINVVNRTVESSECKYKTKL